MRVDYRLVGSGWAECRVEIAGRSATLTASYLTDALDDLLATATRVVRGEPEAGASFTEEPGEYRWRLARLGAERVRVQIFRFDEWRWGTPEGDEEGEKVLDAQCRLRSFAGAVLSTAQALLKEHGEAGYRRQWGMHPFPLERMNALRKALDEHP